MIRNQDTVTIRAICDAYWNGDAGVRSRLRWQYPRLRLEFDAIDYAEDRARRAAAKQAM